MVKKITQSIKKIVPSKRIKKVEYVANAKSHIPYTISMPSSSFYAAIERVLQNSNIVVPESGTKISWKLFVKHNPIFKNVMTEVIDLDQRNYPDKAWDNVANRVIKVVKKYHIPM